MKIISKILSVSLKKSAMAVPSPVGDTAEKMKQQGLYVIQEMLTRMPNSTQAETMSAIQNIVNSGASEFFSKMTPRTVISLPQIYALDQNDIFEVDGKRYVSIEVSPPRKVGQKWTSPSGIQYVKGQDFGGEVVALDLDTGSPTVLSLPPIKDKILVPSENREKLMADANKEIALYNERIGSLTEALGASKIVTQIGRAKRQIEVRIDSLNRIIESNVKQLSSVEQNKKPAFESWAKDLRDGVASGRMSLKDAYDTVLYLNMSTPEQLISGLSSNPPTIQVPEELKAGILAIAKKEAEMSGIKREKERNEKLEEQKRIEEKEVPEIHEDEIKPFTMEDIPGGQAKPGLEKYRTVDLTKSVWHQIAGLKASIDGSRRDLAQLTEIKMSIENMEKYMGALESGQRGAAFLNTPEGKPVLDAMKDFLSKSSLFIKRYATDIIQDGKVNPRLMGPKGTKGNALLAVSLTRMYNVVKETIAMYTGGASGSVALDVPVSKEPVGVEPVAPVQASVKGKIEKLSEILWKAFEDRMKK